ncbi:hypothetical protein ACHAXT_011808 [Thalassiosira profunda]
MAHQFKTASLPPGAGDITTADTSKGGAAMPKNISNTDLAQILGMVAPPTAAPPGVGASASWQPPSDLPPSIGSHLPPVPPVAIAQNADLALDMQVNSMMGGGAAEEKDIKTLLKEAAERAKAARELLADNPSFQEGERKPAADRMEIEGNDDNANGEEAAPEITSKYSDGTDDIGAYFSSSFQQQIGGGAQTGSPSSYAKYAAAAPRVCEREEEECKVDASNQTFAEGHAQTKDEESEDSEGSSLFGDDDDDDNVGEGGDQPAVQFNQLQWQPPETEHVELDDLFGDDDDDDDAAVEGEQERVPPKGEDSDDDSSLFGSSEDEEVEGPEGKADGLAAKPASQPPAKPEIRSHPKPSSTTTFASVEEAKKHLLGSKKPKMRIFEAPKVTEENESEYGSSDDGSVFSLTDRDGGKKAKKKKKASKGGGVLGGLLSKMSSKGSARARDGTKVGSTTKKKQRDSPKKRESKKLLQAMRPPEKYMHSSGDKRTSMPAEHTRVGKSARALVASNKPPDTGAARGKSSLDDVDWQKSYKEKEWEKAFAMMRRYMKRTGGCDVPEGHTLYLWVARQRRMCRKFIRDSVEDPYGEMQGKNLQRYVHAYRLERVGFDWSTAANRGQVRNALAQRGNRVSSSQRESLGMSPKKGTGGVDTLPKRKGVAKPSRNLGSVFESISSKRKRELSRERINLASSDEEEEFDVGAKDAPGPGRGRSSLEVVDNGGFIDDEPSLLAWNEAPKRLRKKRRRGQVAVLSEIPGQQWVKMTVELNERLSSDSTLAPEGGEKRWSNLERAGIPKTTYVVRPPSSPSGKRNIKTTSNGSSSPLRLKARTPLKAKQRSGNKILQTGDRVYAAWWKGRNRSNAPYYYPGVVASHTIVEGMGRSGPALRYDINFDDGDTLRGIHWRLVIKRKKYLKKNLKPSLEVGDEVYSGWWEDKNRAAAPSWHPGVVVNCRQRDYGGPYGPIRLYDIIFDDGDELEAIQDCFVMKKSEYLLSTQKTVESYEVGDDDCSDNDEPKWMGVRNKLDTEAIKEDMWSHDVGWYVVTLDGKEKSFSLLSSALRAYDAYTVLQKGARTKRSDLNFPEWSFPTPPGSCAPVYTGKSEQTTGQDELPVGWKVREHKRPNGSQVDRGANGDETAAMEAFRGSAKSTTVGSGVAVSRSETRSETSRSQNAANENVTLAELEGSRSTTKVIQSLIESTSTEAVGLEETAKVATNDGVDGPAPASASKEADRSSEPSDEFPGWTVEKVKRKSSGTTAHFDKYYYSPKERYRFRSKAAVRRFLECLEGTKDGDEASAMKSFDVRSGKEKAKGSPSTPKTDDDKAGYTSDGSRFSSAPDEGPRNDEMTSTSFGCGTRSTTKAVHEVIDLTNPYAAAKQPLGAVNDELAEPNVSTGHSLAEKEARYPAKLCGEFVGFTVREIPRAKGSHTDRYWYSPVLGHRFRSKLEVRRFLQCLKDNSNDETAALKAMRSTAKGSKDAPKQLPLPAGKPLIEIGDKIFARWGGPGGDGDAWFPGKVSGVREYPGAEYGPVKKYDVVFDDGDTESNVDEVWVAKKAEYSMCLENPEEDWIGVKNVRFPDAKDNYARLIGWYAASIDGKEEIFTHLSAALRASDAYTVRCKKAATKRADLNLAEEWSFPTPEGACSPVHIEQ